MSWRMFVPPLATLAVLAVLALEFFTLRGQWTINSPPPVLLTRIEAELKEEPGGYLAQSPEVDLATLGSRPLFAPGRRESTHNPEVVAPVEVPHEIVAPAPEPAPPPSPPDIVVLGQIHREDRHATLIRHRNTGAEEWIALGGMIDEWTVVDISQQEIRIRLGETEIAVPTME